MLYMRMKQKLLLPYEVLRVASQFVYKDYSKQLLMGIHFQS